MVVYTEDNSLHEWDLASRLETRSWSSLLGEGNRAFSPDGRWCLTSVSHPENIGTSLQELSTGLEKKLDRNWHVAIEFSPDGKFFALGGWQSPARIFETATQRQVGGTFGTTWSIAFSPDQRRLLTAGHGTESVILWDTESYEQLLVLEGQGSLFGLTAFSPDGNIIAASNWRGVMHLWQAPSWSEIEKASREN